MKQSSLYFTFILCFLLIGCKLTKHVPEGESLLYKVNIDSDVKDIEPTFLSDYLRQTPNQKVFGLLNMQLGIYNLSGKDSTKRWNRICRRIGSAPVIFNPRLTNISAQQLQKVFINKGYENAVVTTNIITDNKKTTVNYLIKSNKPYKIGEYNISLDHPLFQKIAHQRSASLIQQGMLFDIDLLNTERERISTYLRNEGCYNFNKDFLVFVADSSNGNNEVSLQLDFRPYLKTNNTLNNPKILKQYTVSKVVYINNSNLNITTQNDSTNKRDTVNYKNFYLIGPKNPFINLQTLIHNTFIEPGAYYNDASVTKTYAAINALGPIKYIDINFKESSDSTLTCEIVTVPGKTISMALDIEGTLTDNYWGVGGGINWTNKNTFRGAESLNIQGKATYEWQEIIWARDLGIQLGLKFPRFLSPIGNFDFKRNIHANTEFRTSFLHQFRPGEFTSTNLNGNVYYNWNKNRFKHNIDLFSLSYVYFPLITDQFRTNFISSGRYNKYNFDDHLILKIGYNGSFSNFIENRPLRNFSSFRYSIETGGNMLYGVNRLLNSQTLPDGSYKLFNVRFAQYARGDFNTSFNQILDKNNRLVYHCGLGLGIPYGNANLIPYERRFYSGGANSVRGWGESRLGPGIYQENALAITRDFNQVGDIKLDLNFEYRAKLFYVFEGALFLDAGNIWTFKAYDEQPGGNFRFNSFMKEIAVAYGAGIRMDFSFFIFRMDLGTRLYDPSRLGAERFRLEPNWEDDFAFHIAVGYPF